MFIQPCADGLTASHRAPFVLSGSRFSPSYFRVVGRSNEVAFTVTHDLSVTISVEPTSVDVDPKMAFDVAYLYAAPALNKRLSSLVQMVLQTATGHHYFFWF